MLTLFVVANPDDIFSRCHLFGKEADLASGSGSAAAPPVNLAGPGCNLKKSSEECGNQKRELLHEHQGDDPMKEKLAFEAPRTSL